MRKLSTQVIANDDDGDGSLLHHGFIHLDFLTDDKHNSITSIAQFKHKLAALA
jgi:hypothetical protein